ncbi:hypothetical protein DBB36_02110 [Flavobacterium sp. WLB]|uniref:hypothetical protein n=1 Tax=unclassified Flavobacterium TaxID=196869 RepID=UPI0006AB9201|nr:MULTISPECIES: hypothetical protein [unclassified Flavobacterium]KOP39228.1 hypothetical protein AKO67_06710 [Flavobacterium sp. VMW]OWU89107.1 hypothetical protein APR43_18045 [Flavobacterium sp. NLM]PUU71674.1 hypothetical protein DBB36_02110 [Flavobacterium sp. WLB]
MKCYCYFLSLSFLIFNSCLKADCESLFEKRKNDDFLIVVQEIPNTGGYRFNIKGINPTTGKKIEYKNDGWSEYNNLISIGDTIIKRKGEVLFSIHKKDTILSLSWQCEGKTYK